MPDLFRYSAAFQPVLLEDMTATLYGADLPDSGLGVRCLAVGSLPELMVDFGALTADTWDTDNVSTNLEMGPMELAQMRMRIVDDMRCQLKHPAAVAQWRSKNVSFYLPQFPQDPYENFLKEYYWTASEFFIWEDTTPRFDFYSFVALAAARVLFSGWRMKLTKLPTTEKGKIKIWTSEWPSGKA